MGHKYQRERIGRMSPTDLLKVITARTRYVLTFCLLGFNTVFKPQFKSSDSRSLLSDIISVAIPLVKRDLKSQLNYSNTMLDVFATTCVNNNLRAMGSVWVGIGGKFSYSR